MSLRSVRDAFDIMDRPGAQRVRRAERELAVSLDDPGQRLAVHLATRVLRVT